MVNNDILDLSKEEEASGILTFDLKVLDDDLLNPLFYKLACGKDCNLEINLSLFLQDFDQGKWHTIGMPLKCLKNKGAELNNIESIIGFSSLGKWSFEIGKIYLEGGEGGKSIFPCN